MEKNKLFVILRDLTFYFDSFYFDVSLLQDVIYNLQTVGFR